MQYFKNEIKVGECSVILSCFLPDAAPRTYYKENRPAVIVLPGGGYGMTYPGEGEPIALSYLARGFCAFVLDYSVYPARFPQALVEAFEAIKAPYIEAVLNSVPTHMRRVKEYELQYLFHSDGWFMLHCVVALLNSGKLQIPTEGQKKMLSTLIIHE